MHMKKTMEEELWEYLDGVLPSAEQQRISSLIEEMPEWKEKYGELLELNASLKKVSLDEPSLRFTKNVMEEIARTRIAPATKNYINRRIIGGIGIFFASLLTAILVYGFSQMEFSSTADSSFTGKISQLDFSKFFNNDLVNVFMMINVVLGLVLLDNYLTGKRKQFRKQA